MKERYYTPQSVEEQALTLYHQVGGARHKQALVFEPLHSALLVLDMQEYFLKASSHAFIPSGEAIVGGIVELVDEYMQARRPVIFTQHINTARDAGMMSLWWKEVITTRNPLHKLISEMNLAGATLIQKSQYDAFYGTNLDEQLQKRKVTQVVVTGVMTHLCCETTARSAFMRGYRVFFPVDGTATYNLDHHRASLVNLAHGFACVVMMKDIHQALRGGRGS